MLKILHFTRNEQGFILPYVLFILVIMMLLVTSSIHIYQNNTRLTQRHIEQLKFETLFQMGQVRFKKDLQEGNIPESHAHDDKQKKEYTFPDGDVTITYKKTDIKESKGMEDPAYHLKFEMTIDQERYSFTHYMSLPE